MGNTAVKVENLSKVYKIYDKPIDRLKESVHPLRKKYHKDFYALDNVNFEIGKGETVGIIGKNGSGKSTLLKIITGVLTPTTGNVSINGKISALLELGAGFNLELTGLENIYLNGTIMGFNKEQIDAKVDSILAFADIGEFIHQPVKTYSSGMFVRLAFSVAINVEPDILIVDEALAVGDIRFQVKCMEKFAQFRKSGKTVIFVSHDINSIKRFCDFVIWLDSGKVVDIGDTNFVTDTYIEALKADDKEFNQEYDIANGKMNSTIIPSINEETPLSAKPGVIVDITSIRLLNSNGYEKESFSHGDKIFVEVIYNVYDDTIAKPVLGVAIRNTDNLYICGLNTLLDKFQISWKKGKNRIVLEYESFELLGGNYYLDVAIFESNATVALDYKAKVNKFFVYASYIGEGVLILKHKWIQ